MALNKKVSLTVIAAAIIGAGVWFGGNYFLSNKIETEAKAYIVKNNLEEHIKWERVEGRLNKKAIFHQVTLSGMTPKETLHIEQLEVNDYDKSDDRFLLDIDLKGITDYQKQPIISSAEELQPGITLESLGITDIPLLNSHIKIKQDRSSNNVTLDVGLNQEKVLDVEFAIDMKNTNTLIDAVREQDNELSPLRVLGFASSMAVGEVSIQFKDKGAIATNAKKNPELIPPKQECLDNLEALHLPYADMYCDAIVKYFSGDASTIMVSAKPQTPYPVVKLVDDWRKVQIMPYMIPDVIEKLNIKVSN
ncbi:hypothetical protein F9B74_01340 [Pelistega sp. NLN82]|uniref:Uncharacterized protein n=1 Tax=Pelistega ratti TaxID=2652177 RepID=A0A6L9Y583_9BURK|nr:hypothetical protein [Pelistega ratti]NEN74974.1 hypothetical protein [Pelistega ratti]